MQVERMTEDMFLNHFETIRGMILDYDKKAKSGIELAELLKRLLEAAINGTALLILNDNQPEGFILAEVIVFDKVNALDILAAYNSAGKDGWEKGWESILELANDFACEKITCESRVGRKWEAYYKRKLSKLGFRPVYIRYSVEVE